MAGNVGRPLGDLVGTAEPGATVICEASSFQLEDASAFAPECAVLLNVEPDHLDRHGTLEEYTAAKMRIFAHDPPHIVMPQDLDADPFDLGDVRLRGEHNRQNARAAALAADAMGVPRDGDRRRAGGVRGRAQPARGGGHGRRRAVRERLQGHQPGVGGQGASSRSPAACTRILGGSLKGGGFEALREPVARALRGRLPDRRGRAGGWRPTSRAQWSCMTAATLERAVDRAAAAAEPGEVVLLSPACASFDAFADYEDRGRRFRELVARAGMNPRTGVETGPDAAEPYPAASAQSSTRS